MRPSKELFRLIWVLVTNLIMLYERVPSLASIQSNKPHAIAWMLEALVAVGVLVSGAVLEIRRSGMAKYLNIGFYLYQGLWGVAGVVAAKFHIFHYDNESWIFLYLVSIPSFIVSVINYVLYRGSKAEAHLERPEKNFAM